MKPILLFASLLIVPMTPPRPTAVAGEVREVHYQMGTFLEIRLWHSNAGTAKALIRDAVKEVHRLDEILSNYNPDSAVSRLNQHAGAGAMAVPAELFELLHAAQVFSEQTGGIFDVTIGSLMELWRRAEEEGRLPDLSQLSAARAAASFKNLALHDADKVELTHPGTRIDLGGIGKGYAVDIVAQRLKAAGMTAALINFGGSSMFAIGAPPGKTGWEITLQDTEGRLRGMIYLSDAALSTSGSMGRSWTINGRRYGHLIDPLSGMPITVARMATVVAPNATQAEALTKPLVLRGKSALPVIKYFPGSVAVVLAGNEPAAFSQRFPNVTSWKEIPTP